MLNNKKFATGFICVGIFAIIAAVFVMVINPKPYRTDISAALDEAVALSIFTNKEVSLSDITIDGVNYRYAAVGDSARYFGSECMGEGHIILGFNEKGSAADVYALCSYAGYGFVNGIFVDNTGASCVPTLIKFSINETGDYIFKSAQEAKDGAQFAASIKNMFPAALAKKANEALSDTEILESLQKQCDMYAENYLKVIGREAKVSSFGEEDFKLLSDYGVSTDVENALYDLHPEYGLYIGNFESIEDGVRYVYSKTWKGKENGVGTLTYTKKNYKTGKAVEKYSYNIEEDQFTEVKAKKKK